MPVLRGKRLVDAELVSQLLILLRGVAGGLARQHRLCGIAGSERAEDEGEDRDREETHHRGCQPPRRCPDHLHSSSLAPLQAGRSHVAHGPWPGSRTHGDGWFPFPWGLYRSLWWGRNFIAPPWDIARRRAGF